MGEGSFNPFTFSRVFVKVDNSDSIFDIFSKIKSSFFVFDIAKDLDGFDIFLVLHRRPSQTHFLDCSQKGFFVKRRL